MLLESLKIFLPFNSGLFILFHSFSPSYHRSSQSFLDGILVGTLSKIDLSTMRHILFIRNSYLLANNAMVLGTVMPRRLVVGSFIVAGDTST